jgi:hypothetical protein
MGLYKLSFIQEHKEEILNLKNKDKLFYVMNEYFIFKKNKINKQFFLNTPDMKGQEIIYGTNTIRQVEYCQPIGLYKYKANWYVREDWVNKV